MTTLNPEKLTFKSKIFNENAQNNPNKTTLHYLLTLLNNMTHKNPNIFTYNCNKQVFLNIRLDLVNLTRKLKKNTVVLTLVEWPFSLITNILVSYELEASINEFKTNFHQYFIENIIKLCIRGVLTCTVFLEFESFCE